MLLSCWRAATGWVRWGSLAFFAWLAPAWGDASAREPAGGGIVVVHGESGASSAARVAAELKAQGWRVIAVDDAGEALAELAEERAATAVVRILPRSSGIELWIAAPNAEESPVHETVRLTRRTDDVLALRAVEVLRARLLKLGVQPPLQESVAPLPPTPERPPANPPRRAPSPSLRRETLAWIEWGATAGWGSTELGVLPTLRLGVAAEPSRGFTLGLLLMPPLLSSSLAEAEGSSEVRWGLVGAWAGWATPRTRAADLMLGAGVGGVGLWLDGNAQRPLSGHDVSVQAWTVFARVGPGVRLSPSVHLRLEAIAGVALPEPVIAFAGREVTDWGRPFVTISAQTEVRLASVVRPWRH